MAYDRQTEQAGHFEEVGDGEFTIYRKAKDVCM